MENIVLMFEDMLKWIVKTIDGPLWDITVLTLLGVGLFFYSHNELSTITFITAQHPRNVVGTRRRRGISYAVPSLCDRAGKSCRRR